MQPGWHQRPAAEMQMMYEDSQPQPLGQLTGVRTRMQPPQQAGFEFSMAPQGAMAPQFAPVPQQLDMHSEMRPSVQPPHINDFDTGNVYTHLGHFNNYGYGNGFSGASQ